MDKTVFPQHPEADGIVRDTTHRAVLQPGTRPEMTPPQSAPYQPHTSEYIPPETTQPEMTKEEFTADTFEEPFETPATSTTSRRIPGIHKPIQEELVFEWQAQSRPFKQRTRQFFSTILIIGLLISLILFFAGQVLPIAVVVAIVFLVYVLSVIPPGTAYHAVTTFGIRIEDQLYYWEELGRFWFTEKYQQKIIHIEVARFPWRLNMLLGEVPEKDLAEIIAEVLVQQTPALTTYEKMATWLQEKIPLDSE